MRRVAAGLLLAGLLVAGCGGGPPGDLFVVTRTGSVPGAKLTLRITNDGGAYCNSAGRAEITSAQLISARDIKRRLDGDENAETFTDAEKRGLARDNLRLKPGRATIFRYSVLSEEGRITFYDSSPGQKVVPLLVRLTHDVARGSCHLAR